MLRFALVSAGLAAVGLGIFLGVRFAMVEAQPSLGWPPIWEYPPVPYEQYEALRAEANVTPPFQGRLGDFEVTDKGSLIKEVCPLQGKTEQEIVASGLWNPEVTDIKELKASELWLPVMGNDVLGRKCAGSVVLVQVGDQLGPLRRFVHELPVEVPVYKEGLPRQETIAGHPALVFYPNKILVDGREYYVGVPIYAIAIERYPTADRPGIVVEALWSTPEGAKQLVEQLLGGE